MELINELTNDEKFMMERYIKEYAYSDVESRKIPASMDYLLRFWNDAKSQYLYKILGNQFIISKNIVFEKDAVTLESDMSNFINEDNSNSFIKEFQDYIWIQYFQNEDDHTNYYELSKLVNPRVLVSNVYDGKTIYIDVPNSTKPFKIQNGCKPMRAISKLAEIWNISGFEAFRLKHSLILNDKKMSGKLSLSIHPFDYMTMSDNKSGWSSCMSWSEDGEYKRGTVEMMNSPMVVVAYLSSENDMIVPGGMAWNNKKWRELFIVTPEFISGIKGYPIWNRNLEDEVIYWLRDLINTNYPEFGNYEDKIYIHNFDRYNESTKEEKQLEFPDNVMIHLTTEAMYNDYYLKHHFMLANDKEKLKNVDICYSGPGECMYCGASDSEQDFDYEGMLTCESCSNIIKCDCCGDRISLDAVIEFRDTYICEYCYDNLPTCDLTDEACYSEDLVSLYVGFNNMSIISDAISLDINSNLFNYTNDILPKNIHLITYTLGDEDYKYRVSNYVIDEQDCSEDLKNLIMYKRCYNTWEEAKEYMLSNYSTKLGNNIVQDLQVS